MLRWLGFCVVALLMLMCSVAKAEQYQSCNGITFYSADDDPAGLNIRSGPGTKHPVVGKTRWHHLYMTAFKVIGSQDGWFKVQAVGEWNYRKQQREALQSYAGIGWVSAKKLRVEYYAGDTIVLHSQPGSKASRSIPVELEISGPQRLVACQGQWVLVEHDEIIEMADDPKDEKSKTDRGWIDGICKKGKRCPFLPSGGQ
jgi:hypothetical protein